MIYLELFLGFLKIGLFSFGGAYGAVPLIRETVMSHNFGITEEEFAYLLAVSESTPGPVMVNTATYIGHEAAGFWGSVIATFTVCLPAFVIILLFAVFFKNALENRNVRAALDGVKPCVAGIITATGLYMISENCLSAGSEFKADKRALLIAAVLFAVPPIYKKIRGKSLSPILLIVSSACLGILTGLF